jgi:hypothetical protein
MDEDQVTSTKTIVSNFHLRPAQRNLFAVTFLHPRRLARIASLTDGISGSAYQNMYRQSLGTAPIGAITRPCNGWPSLTCLNV